MKSNFLFWNVHKKELRDLIGILLKEHDVDIALLAECPGKSLDAREAYIHSLRDYLDSTFDLNYTVKTERTSYVKFLVKAVSDLGFQDELVTKDRLSALPIRLPSDINILLIGTHLESKVGKSDGTQSRLAVQTRKSIEEIEKAHDIENTILVGDLNMNPFDSGIIAATALNAVMSRQVAANSTRKFSRNVYKYFYNPMWKFFASSASEVQGTHYFSNSEECYYWNILDQVLIRLSLLDHFRDSDIEILTWAGTESLLYEGIPHKDLISDHLPIRFSLLHNKVISTAGDDL
jgi:hypothetical protein